MIKGADVVMTIGPTGAGKSTIINRGAGSKVTFEQDTRTKKWIATADPVKFPIGHTKSCTLTPTFWKNEKTGMVIGDCPGFNDTRGLL